MEFVPKNETRKNYNVGELNDRMREIEGFQGMKTIEKTKWKGNNAVRLKIKE